MHFLFAWRYFRGKYNFQAIQMIAWVSVVAIAVGTAALIIVLSVSNGFTEVVKGLYADFYADVRVTPVEGKFFSMRDAPYQKLVSIEGVRAVSKVVESRALLVKGDLQSVVLVKGVDKNYSKRRGQCSNFSTSIYRERFLESFYNSLPFITDI